jgi:hypothetical protein
VRDCTWSWVISLLWLPAEMAALCRRQPFRYSTKAPPPPARATGICIQPEGVRVAVPLDSPSTSLRGIADAHGEGERGSGSLRATTALHAYGAFSRLSAVTAAQRGSKGTTKRTGSRRAGGSDVPHSWMWLIIFVRPCQAHCTHAHAEASQHSERRVAFSRDERLKHLLVSSSPLLFVSLSPGWWLAVAAHGRGIYPHSEPP